MELITLVIVAAIVESTWENLKPIWKTGEIDLNKVGTLVLGVLVAVYAGVDIFEIIGLPLALPIAGAVLTGILVSRGANVVHDLIGIIAEYKEG